MNSKELVQKFNIEGKTKGKEFIFSDCPYCGSKEHFSLNMENGAGQCFRCGKKTSSHGLNRLLSLKQTQDIDSNILDKDMESFITALWSDTEALKYLKEARGYSEDTIKKLQLGLMNIQGHPGYGFIAFPCFDNFKLKTFQLKNRVIGAKPKYLWYPQSETKKNIIYNIDSIKDLKKCLIVEGPPDVAAAITYGITNVVGICGANSFPKRLVSKFKDMEKIYIWMDNDDDPDREVGNTGQLAAYDIATLLGLRKCFKIDSSLYGVKDLNQALIEQFPWASENSADILTLVLESKLFDPPGFELISKVASPKTLHPGWPTGFPKLDFYLKGGIRPGAITIVVGDDSAGKSSFCRHLAINFADAGLTTAYLTLEEEAKDTKFKLKIVKGLSPAEEFSEDYPLVLPKGSNDTTQMKVTDFIKVIAHLVDRYQLKVIFLDDLAMVMETAKASAGDAKWNQESSIMMKLLDLVKSFQVHIIALRHPHKTPHKTWKNAKDVDEDRFEHNDVDGSKYITNRAGNIWCIKRDKWSSINSNLVKIIISKNRQAGGDVGCIQTRYDKITTRFTELQ